MVRALDIAEVLHKHGYVSDETWAEIQAANAIDGGRSKPLTVMLAVRDVLLQHGYLDPVKYEAIDSTYGRLAALDAVARGVGHLALRQEMARLDGIDMEAHRKLEETHASRHRRTPPAH